MSKARPGRAGRVTTLPEPTHENRPTLLAVVTEVIRHGRMDQHADGRIAQDVLIAMHTPVANAADEQAREMNVTNANARVFTDGLFKKLWHGVN